MSSNSLTTLSYAARRELIERVAPLYREASLAQKGLLLDRMVAMTGYARKYAIRLLNQTPEGKLPTGASVWLGGTTRALVRLESDERWRNCQTFLSQNARCASY